MVKLAEFKVKEQNLIESLQRFFKTLLVEGKIDAILVPQHLPMKNVVMPTLVTDPEKLNKADPLAPSFPINAAKLVSRLTRKPLGGSVAVVLRSCEIRAFIELVKLKQGCMDEVLVVGIDCLGACSNVEYLRFAGDDGADATIRFY